MTHPLPEADRKHFVASVRSILARHTDVASAEQVAEALARLAGHLLTRKIQTAERLAKIRR